MAAELIDLLESCVEDNPDDRPGDAAALAETLKGWLGHASEPEPDPDPGPSSTLRPSVAKPAKSVPAVIPSEQDAGTIVNSLGMTLVRVEPGEFTMGTTDAQLEQLARLFPKSKRESFADEQPAHRVRITRPYYLGAHQVTVGQFRRFVESEGYRTEAERHGEGGWGFDQDRGTYLKDPKYNWRDPGFPQGDDHPVVNVSWNDANAFCEWLSRAEPNGGRYRLPTEAEWEHACRAGTTTLYPNGDDPERLAEIGNVADASLKRTFPDQDWATIQADDGFAFTAPVGRFPAIRGLYDTIGNVWEWCQDGYDAAYYQKSPPVSVDPRGAADGSSRVDRGGSWSNAAVSCRAACRGRDSPTNAFYALGLRVARVPAE